MFSSTLHDQMILEISQSGYKFNSWVIVSSSLKVSPCL
jgi:molecular chaperone GrpE (heat shock protein)